MEQGFYYVIPAKLAEGGDHLKALAYGLISSLCSAEGFCWASNAYLAKKLGRKSKNVVSEAIQALENEGWIKSSVDRAKGNKRRITLVSAYPMVDSRATSTEITGEGSTEITGQSIKTESKKIESYTGAEINVLLDLFKAVNPSYAKLFKIKPQRRALEELVKAYGRDKVERMIKAAAGCFGQPFAPTITTPLQLQDNLGKLIAFYKKAQSPRVVEV